MQTSFISAGAISCNRNASVPQFTGILLPDENYGIVDSRGLEVVLGYRDRAGEFTYSINGNIAFARNKIIEFDEPAKSVAWQRLTDKPQGSQLIYKALAYIVTRIRSTKVYTCQAQTRGHHYRRL